MGERFDGEQRGTFTRPKSILNLRGFNQRSLAVPADSPDKPTPPQLRRSSVSLPNVRRDLGRRMSLGLVFSSKSADNGVLKKSDSKDLSHSYLASTRRCLLQGALFEKKGLWGWKKHEFVLISNKDKPGAMFKCFQTQNDTAPTYRLFIDTATVIAPRTVRVRDFLTVTSRYGFIIDNAGDVHEYFAPTREDCTSWMHAIQQCLHPETPTPNRKVSISRFSMSEMGAREKSGITDIFTVHEILGEGTSSVVRRATNKRTGMEVALKIVPKFAPLLLSFVGRSHLFPIRHCFISSSCFVSLVSGRSTIVTSMLLTKRLLFLGCVVTIP